MNAFHRNHMARRRVLQAGCLGVSGVTLADLLRFEAAAATDRDDAEPAEALADSVLFVNLAGGPSHLDTLDMKPDAPAETRGEFSSIASRIPGLQVCEHLPQIASIVDRCTLIRGISHTTGDHPQGQAYIGTGNRPSPAIEYPAYGSIVTRELPGDPDLPGFVAIPTTEWNAGYMGDSFAPFQTNAVPQPGEPFSVRGLTRPMGLTVEKVTRREQLRQEFDQTFRQADTGSPLLDALDTFGQQAYRMIMSRRTREAFDVSLEEASIRERFAGDEPGQSLLLATRLIGSGVRFVTVTNTGWDTHLDNFDGHKRLMPPIDAAVSAAIRTLSDKGLLDRTLVVVMGEFGRTPKINENVGRDHYPRANWCLMAGGGVRTAQLIGATDDHGEGPTDDTRISPDDIGASIFHALGIDHHKEYHTRTNRPVRLIPHGQVVDGLF